jgi:hypothetical protein
MRSNGWRLAQPLEDSASSANHRDRQLACAVKEGSRRPMKNQELLACAAGVSGPATSCRPAAGPQTGLT